MEIDTALDLDVLFSAITASAVSSSFQGYLGNGWSCEYFAMALRSSSGGGQFVYEGVAAFDGPTTGALLAWEYTKVSSSGSTPSVPPDTITTTTTQNHQIPAGICCGIDDATSFNYLGYLATNPPAELGGLLQTRRIVGLEVEHEISPAEKVVSRWEFVDSSGASTIVRVWSTVSGGVFGPINVN